MNEAKVYPVKHPSYAWMVQFRRRGFKQYRAYFTTKKAAEDDAKAFNDRLYVEGAKGLRISAADRHRIAALVAVAGERGYTWDDVIELVKRQPPKAEAKVTLEDAAWRFIDYRERQGRSAATLAGLKTRLLGESGFIRHCGRELLADVQEADCREFIMRPARPTTARNNLTVLKNFLSWCVRMGLRRDSPADRVDMPARERGKAPAILTPEDTAAFMEALRGHRDGSFVAYYALLLFAGLRPSEVTELQEDDIRTTGIRVTGGKMRGRARRIAPMLPSLRSWLAAYPVDWAVLGMRTDARAFTDARKLCPARWETDVARHSFISYRLAVVHDERQVAREAGNSPDMIFAHYFEMADRREAGRYFSIRP